MPIPVVALPCGSRSMTKTRNSSSASAAPRFTAVVVLPTPPFWLAIEITRGSVIGSGASPPLARIAANVSTGASVSIRTSGSASRSSMRMPSPSATTSMSSGDRSGAVASTTVGSLVGIASSRCCRSLTTPALPAVPRILDQRRRPLDAASSDAIGPPPQRGALSGKKCRSTTARRRGRSGAHRTTGDPECNRPRANVSRETSPQRPLRRSAGCAGKFLGHTACLDEGREVGTVNGVDVGGAESKGAKVLGRPAGGIRQGWLADDEDAGLGHKPGGDLGRGGGRREAPGGDELHLLAQVRPPGG